MAIPHAGSNEPIDVKPFGTQLTSEKTTALFKSEQLEAMRVVLQAGKSLPPHKVPGEITIQCIEGEIEVTAEGQGCRLLAGQMIFLLGNVLHEVFAHQDSSALVTIVLAK